MELFSFRKFNEKESAVALGRLLEENGIGFEVVSDAYNLDALYGGTELNNFYHVRIAGSDFLRAKQILRDDLQAQVDKAETDHYLFEFDNAELLEVVYKSDEWSEFDYLLARRILRERGEAIQDHTIRKLDQSRKQELAKPDEMDIRLSYSKSMFGLFGALLAWSIITDKKTLPDGQRVYTYSKRTRDQAQLLFFISMVVTIVATLVIIGVIEYVRVDSLFF
jgi:hypothetical protein